MEPSRNIALLIDADNASHAGIDPVLTVLAELGAVNVRRAYGNWSKPALKGWAAIVHRYGIEPQQQFDLTRGKNATDMKMTIDALDLLHRGHVHGFGIMSSDSDFMPLAMRIRQDGLPVYGFGNVRTPEAFTQACTRFIDVEALVSAELSDEQETKNAEISVGGKVDAALTELLIGAYNAAKRDERGFAAIGEIGKIAGNRSSFDVRNYGFKRLSEMFVQIPIFQTERRENGQLFVKRVR